MPISENEISLLRALRDKGDHLVKGDTPSPGLQDLADRGYVRFPRALCGPLAIPTGETMVALTEAGREAIEFREIAIDLMHKYVQEFISERGSWSCQPPASIMEHAEKLGVTFEHIREKHYAEIYGDDRSLWPD
jgi:hypothetical protein